MRVEFCTLLDRRYLPRAVVLARSLAAHREGARLRVFCMDRETKAALDLLQLPGTVTTGIDELERFAPEVMAPKAGRSWVEYLWTATPATCLYSLAEDRDLDAVVRLDADVEFFADPELLLTELGDASVLLTPHDSSPEFRDVGEIADEWGGTFNVSCEVFRRDEAGLAALRWWHERCIEWCFDRFEPGRYGDQKYLEEIPARFDGVRSNEHPGAGLAPWNVASHSLEWGSEGVCVDGRPLVFHHFQSLELHGADPFGRGLAKVTAAYRLTDGPAPVVWTTGWRLEDEVLDGLWAPHVQRIAAALEDLRSAGVEATLPPARPGRAAFQVARRRTPAWVKAPAWRLREAAWRRRRGRLAPMSLRSAVAATIRTLAGRAYRRAERLGERFLVDRRLHLPAAASGRIELDEVGAAAPGRWSYEASPWGVLGRILPEEDVGTEDVFLDLGCGMGRVLLEAARMPFKRVVGVDVVPEFTAVARQAALRNRSRLRCSDVEVVTTDVLDYEIPDDVTVVYLAAPFGEHIMRHVIGRIIASVDRVPRAVRVIHLFPPHAPRLDWHARLRRVRNGRRRIRRWAEADYLKMYEVKGADG